MRKLNREINIFSMSALDLFASSLGVFVLITILLLPFYPHTGDSAKQLSRMQKQLQQCRNDCRRSKQRYILISISWGTPAPEDRAKNDVDLHVVDPAGNEYNFRKKSYPGSAARMEVDSRWGPSSEVWFNPDPKAGVYKVYYNLYRADTPSVEVRGRIVVPAGRVVVPVKRLVLDPAKRRVLAAKVIVKADGEIVVKPQ